MRCTNGFGMLRCAYALRGSLRYALDGMTFDMNGVMRDEEEMGCVVCSAYDGGRTREFVGVGRRGDSSAVGPASGRKVVVGVVDVADG